MKKISVERNLTTTITASCIAVLVGLFTILLLPAKDLAGVFTISCGALLVVLCVGIALEGRKGTIRDIFYWLSFWS